MPEIKLYFTQHGLAVDKIENPERPLSNKGRQQTQAMADKLHSAGTQITHIFHSGKRRAAETADIFATTLQIDNVSTVDYLSPMDDVKQFTHQAATNNALFVGHLPHLEKLIAYLVTGNEDNEVLRFQNSAVACLEQTHELYQLQWFITPDFTSP